MVNLIPNPDFEVNTTGWNGHSATISRSTAQAHTGVASLLVATLGAITFESGYTAPIAATVNTLYVLETWLYEAVGGATLGLRIDEYLGVAFIRNTRTNYTTTAGWQNLTHSVRTGTGINRVVVAVDTGSNIQDIDYYLDGVLLQPLENTNTIPTIGWGSA